MTLEEARADVLDRCDDAQGRRHAPGGDYDKVDRALDVALSRRLDDYIAAGGDRFDENVDLTTSTAGVADLTAYEPIKIRGVLIIPDGDSSYFPIRAVDRARIWVPVETDYNLRIVLVRRHIVPRDKPDQLLVGGSFGGAVSWEAFDDWVVSTAALRLGIKDDEMRRSLMADMDGLEKSVIGHARMPRELAWPDARRSRWSTWNDLVWTTTPRDQTVTLYRGGAS